MARPAVCPECGEQLDVPPEMRGNPVRCGGCMTVFTPPADEPARPADRRVTDDDAADDRRRPTARRVRDDDDDDDYDDRPRRRRPRRPPASLAWLWLTVGGILVFCGLPCVGLMGLGFVVEYPRFQPHTSADGRFTAEFPGVPTTSTDTDAKGTKWTTAVFRRPLPPETYTVKYTDLPAPRRGAATDATVELNAAADAVVAQEGGAETSRTVVLHDGHPAVDVVIDLGDDTTFARLVLVGRRVYVLTLTGDVEPEAPRLKAFRDKFKPAAGK